MENLDNQKTTGLTLYIPTNLTVLWFVCFTCMNNWEQAVPLNSILVIECPVCHQCCGIPEYTFNNFDKEN